MVSKVVNLSSGGCVVSWRDCAVGFCCKKVRHSVVRVGRSPLRGTCAIASMYSFHPCYHGNSIYVPKMQALEWLMTEAGLYQLDMCFCSTSPMMDVLWWSLTCEIRIFTLYAHFHMFNHMALPLSLLFPSLPSFPLLNPWSEGQAIQHCPWVPVYSNFRPLLFPHKVADQVGGILLTVIFQDHVESGAAVQPSPLSSFHQQTKVSHLWIKLRLFFLHQLIIKNSPMQ